MAHATERRYVRIAQQLGSADDVLATLQQHVDAIHELNARIYFLQEQLAVVASATATPIYTLEDY